MQLFRDCTANAREAANEFTLIKAVEEINLVTQPKERVRELSAKVEAGIGLLVDADLNGLRQWSKPLGLVRRADRLVECAHRLLRDYGGHAPQDLHCLQPLPGTSMYSAHATLCMASNHPPSMIDEGSGRVLRRVLELPNARPAYSDIRLAEVTERNLPGNHTREYSLGLIEIGAAYCRPRMPGCPKCPQVVGCKIESREVRNQRAGVLEGMACHPIQTDRGHRMQGALPQCRSVQL